MRANAGLRRSQLGLQTEYRHYTTNRLHTERQRDAVAPVSYTHLDVYKRQLLTSPDILQNLFVTFIVLQRLTHSVLSSSPKLVIFMTISLSLENILLHRPTFNFLETLNFSSQIFCFLKELSAFISTFSNLPLFHF